MPDSVRLVLELAAGGVKLTPGGRLPRSFVRQVQQERPEWAWSDKPASREEDLIPLLALHDVLREVGLLRLGKGVLQPIKAAADERQVVRRLRSWFEADRFTDLLAGLTVAELVRRGESTDRRAAAAAVFPRLGPAGRSTGEPLTRERVRAGDRPHQRRAARPGPGRVRPPDLAARPVRAHPAPPGHRAGPTAVDSSA